MLHSSYEHLVNPVSSAGGSGNAYSCCACRRPRPTRKCIPQAGYYQAGDPPRRYSEALGPVSAGRFVYSATMAKTDTVNTPVHQLHLRHYPAGAYEHDHFVRSAGDLLLEVQGLDRVERCPGSHPEERSSRHQRHLCGLRHQEIPNRRALLISPPARTPFLLPLQTLSAAGRDAWGDGPPPVCGGDKPDSAYDYSGIDNCHHAGGPPFLRPQC